MHLIDERAVERMRCLFCNAEMVLMEAVQADPTTLPSFEHRTFLCPACHGVERRLAYAGARAPSATSHSGSPATNLNIGSGMPQSAWSRAVEKVLHKQIELNGRAAAKRRPGSPQLSRRSPQELSHLVGGEKWAIVAEAPAASAGG